jgi:hypothetical protein
MRGATYPLPQYAFMGGGVLSQRHRDFAFTFYLDFRKCKSTVEFAILGLLEDAYNVCTRILLSKPKSERKMEDIKMFTTAFSNKNV